jgi:hypothetical protein
MLCADQMDEKLSTVEIGWSMFDIIRWLMVDGCRRENVPVSLLEKKEMQVYRTDVANRAQIECKECIP